MGTQYQPQDKHKFINCELEFKCSENWFELELTDKAGIKHCLQCEEDVHLCMDQEELDKAIEKKYCIAYFKDPGYQTRFTLSREKCEANVRDPDFKPLVLLGLPRNYASGRLMKFLDEEDDE